MLKSVSRNLLVLGLLAACTPPPERFTTSNKSANPKSQQGAVEGNSDLDSNGTIDTDDTDTDEGETETGSTETMEPPTVPPVTTPNPPSPPTPPEPPVVPPEPPEVPSAVPKDCEGDSTVDTKDLVIFDGKAVTVSDNKVPLSAEWIINDTWGNAKLGVESKSEQKVITFTGETKYHGFKITPISPAGQTKKFVAMGVDIYVSSSKDGSPFGLRIIKPGEDESNGGATTTSWYKTSAQSTKEDNKPDTPNLSASCKLLRFYITPSFIQNNKVSTRFIWEMMDGWNPSDKLYIHKIVMKDFSWK